jgi:quercetin dioxygenase-like cupin family protein
MDTSSLHSLAEKHLAAAREASSGRSAHTVYGGHDRTLRQTVIALAAGQRLDEHENPGEATLHVLLGRVRMVAGDDRAEAGAGDLIVVPQARHHLEALADSAVLLTVAKR